MVGPVLGTLPTKRWSPLASCSCGHLLQRVAFSPQASRVYLSCRKVIRETLAGSETKCQTW